MKVYLDKFKKAYKEDKKTFMTYIILRILIIICLIRELMLGNIENVFLCILSLILFFIPSFIEEKFKIDFPSSFERTVYIFIFCAEILGEINNFYGHIEFWDTALHTVNGFLCASIGFSLVYLLNNKINTFKISAIFVSLVSFCFSMTVGVAWEIFEYAMDEIVHTDMQKDTYVENIRTVELDPLYDNNVIKIEGINYVIIYNENNEQLIKLDKYLDIGLHDTMEDLIVNFIGAFVFSILGYLSIKDEKKYKVAKNLMTTRK